jgi:phosphoribosyl 1,2-cyclic phosphate phosphodiesterase
MSHNLKFTILGCSNSTGVPAAGNHWGSCNPNEPKNIRSRPSLLVQSQNTTIIIDCGPDFRMQTTNANINHLDALLLTHAHGDHINGIDDVRTYMFRQKSKIPLYLNQETLTELERRYTYIFQTSENGLYQPVFAPTILNENYHKHMRIGDIDLIPFPQNHGDITTVGYRFGDFAYSTDVKALNAAAINTLKGIKTWVVDAAGYHQENNPVHANLKEVYAMNEQIGAKTIYLTSLSLAMDYQTLCDELPKGYKPAYDGLIL